MAKAKTKAKVKAKAKTKVKSKKKDQIDTNEKILGYLVEIDTKVAGLTETVIEMKENMVTKADLADTLKDYATKNDLERVKEDIIDEIRPVIKAVDKDAETIFNHEERITALEHNRA